MGTSIFWHRRDLRIEDNAGLYHALKEGKNVQPVFVFDSLILSHLEENDQRVLFIYRELEQLKKDYRSFGADLKVYYGDPVEVIPRLQEEFDATSVYTNRDYEPYAQERDRKIYTILFERGVAFKGFKDHVIFEKNEVLKDDGTPYTVFTPYMRKWKQRLTSFYLRSYPTLDYVHHLRPSPMVEALPSLSDMGFLAVQRHSFPSKMLSEMVLRDYHEQRDIPAIEGTSRLSLHLRFGTVSLRSLARQAMHGNEKYFNELIWRDFYQMILFHFPHSANAAFKPMYDRVEWEVNPKHFEAWCNGNTGYPLVDAGMRELLATGFMHNRVRMVVASFFTKHLLLDWRLGERFFAKHLLDFELASNVGGWQWAAGSGCDAAPYFRVFNPSAQQAKFDPKEVYIKRWVPEYGTTAYPEPIVEHKFARERAIARYKAALQ